MIKRLFRPLQKAKPNPPPVAVPEGERIYAIGDIHGRAELLDALQGKIMRDLDHSKPVRATFVYLGDYIDRGPDSSGVLDRLCADPPPGVNRVLLKGNHEEMLLRFLAEPESGSEWRDYGGMETVVSYGVGLKFAFARGGFGAIADELRQKLPASHLGLLESLARSATAGDYFFCHAGVRPGVPLHDQREADLIWIRDLFLESARDFGKVVVHGHTPVADPDIRHNRINIDTGACETDRLTCLVLEGTERRFLMTGAEDCRIAQEQAITL